ncbi:MAG: leucine-rich repeat domain-containing protein [Muribaculaceae bacterium]|nr:leucine-rich repeat domain-containing protein [Muribaculaceae bacterium]
MSHTFKSAILLLALILLPLSATAYDFMEGGIAYDINSDGQSVTVTYEQLPEYSNHYVSYSNASGSLTIPSTVLHNGKTYSVTKIGYRAFYGCSGFTGSLTIPNSVTTIGNYAFFGCSGITEITIPSDLADIGSNAFNGTGWYYNQPEGVVYLCNVALCYKGTVPDGTALKLRDGIKGIAYYAFEGCSGFTGSLNIPNSVTDIGNYAFSGCSGFTGSLTIPNSVPLSATMPSLVAAVSPDRSTFPTP